MENLYCQKYTHLKCSGTDRHAKSGPTSSGKGVKLEPGRPSLPEYIPSAVSTQKLNHKSSNHQITYG